MGSVPLASGSLERSQKAVSWVIRVDLELGIYTESARLRDFISVPLVYMTMYLVFGKVVRTLLIKCRVK